MLLQKRILQQSYIGCVPIRTLIDTESTIAKLSTLTLVILLGLPAPSGNASPPIVSSSLPPLLATARTGDHSVSSVDASPLLLLLSCPTSALDTRPACGSTDTLPRLRALEEIRECEPHRKPHGDLVRSAMQEKEQEEATKHDGLAVAL